MPDRLHAAVAAGVMASEEDFTRLLRSIVEVARAIFGAQGSSIFLLDEEADELVFAAVAGDQDQFLVGQRFPSSTGIAGWVASSQTPLVLEDVQADPRFARDIAERSGYVPKGIMAVPAARRGTRARRAAGARPPVGRPLLAAGDGAARPVRGPGRDRALIARDGETRRAVLAGDAACLARRRASPRRSSGSRAARAGQRRRPSCAASPSCSRQPQR